MELLALVLRDHKDMQFLDLSDNELLDTRACTRLLDMLQANVSIQTARFHVTVPEDWRLRLMDQVEQNLNSVVLAQVPWPVLLALRHLDIVGATGGGGGMS